jgi:hypothetical protein
MTHPYTWKDVRDVRAQSLAIGETFVKPGMGTAFYSGSDGRVRGAGWQELDGTAWTVIAREGDVTTCRADDGREATQAIPSTAHVLRVTA